MTITITKNKYYILLLVDLIKQINKIAGTKYVVGVNTINNIVYDNTTSSTNIDIQPVKSLSKYDYDIVTIPDKDMEKIINIVTGDIVTGITNVEIDMDSSYLKIEF